MPRVLVLDASQRSALACIRSLGRIGGIEIHAADSATNAIGGASRYCAQYWQHPPVREAPAQFIAWLRDFTTRTGIDLVFPMTEFSSQLILIDNERSDEAPIPVAFADHATVLSLADKGRLVALARSLDIPCPASSLHDSAAAVDLDAIDRFPVVVKPCLSHLWLEDRWLSTSVQIAEDRAALERILSGSPWLQQHAFMLQEFIPGRGAGVFALYDQGRAVAFFAHRRLREKPPGGGVSVLSESIPLDPQLLAQSRRLLDAAGWHGVAMVEFRIDGQGRAWLMEVNTRFWGSLQLAIDAGVDFPGLLYRISQGERLPEQSGYRHGRRLRWLLGDLDSLYLVMRSRDYPVSHKLKRLLDFFTPRPFSTRHEVDRWSDPMPALTELRLYLSDLFK
jgi:predicted ATP-grasp superfamily ATP-dependent carboligase